MIREDLLRTVRDLSARHDTKAFAELVESVHPSDMAEALETLKSRDVARLLPCLKAGALAEVFVYFSEERQSRLLQELPRETVVALFEGMAADERVDLFHDLDEAARQRLLPALAHGEREDILRLAAYAEGSVGSVTTSDYVAVLPDMSVAQALAHVRATAADKETIYVIYVQDKEGHLCGTLSLRELLLADDSLTIRNIMRRDPVFARAQWPRSKASELIGRYDLLALPVINGGEKMVGIVTVDDAMDVIEEETTEDFEKMAAMLPSDKPYLKTSIFSTWKARLPWLMVLMLSATFTGMILNHYESKLAACLVLNAYIPMLSGTGGNSGTQASVAVIRALSLDEVDFSDILQVLWKELRVSFLCGVCLAAANFVKMLLVDRMLLGNDAVNFTVCAVVCLTILFVVIFAKCVGCCLPLLAEKVGLDPAVMASPFITTIVDATSLLIYFALASALIPALHTM